MRHFSKLVITLQVACIASTSVQFQSKERGNMSVKYCAKMALDPLFARRILSFVVPWSFFALKPRGNFAARATLQVAININLFKNEE